MDREDGPGPDTSSDGFAISRRPLWRVVLLDFGFVLVWVSAVSLAWRSVGWPMWAYYLVVFGGIVGYSLARNPWKDGGHD